MLITFLQKHYLSLFSATSYTYAFDGFQKGVGVNIKTVKNEFEIDIFFLGFCIVVGCCSLVHFQLFILQKHKLFLSVEVINSASAALSTLKQL